MAPFTHIEPGVTLACNAEVGRYEANQIGHVGDHITSKCSRTRLKPRR